ncbi:hypothetical protein RhiXN_00237 [Rhizoctonia solani]|uniref:Uncharacterized protein n=1 Tax=Rhizoctonia solani TaxID=456999 RepID=A0A8H8NUU9_9AGAM|nr:uncharacterized protein RhiXN_00237 [Rhizoctonia solani]QRW18831.1 hypothetical protein RhiXN_00237 [Rhizoctonia solani]
MFPTRVQLESLKRAALQAKCKELGIKANSRSEVLIDMVLERYFSTAGPSKPSTSTASSSKKRKADDEPKARRVRAKAEPQDEVLPTRTSPRRGKRAEVVIRTPARLRRLLLVLLHLLPPPPLALLSPPPLPQLLSTPPPIFPPNLKLNHRHPDSRSRTPDSQRPKAGDESARESFGDSTSSDTLDSMGQLAQLRDVAPRLVALAMDPVALTSRVDAAADCKLETDSSRVGELQATLRHLQSQFNRIPESVFNNNRPEDSVADSRYTIVRASSVAPSAGPSGSQPSLLSIPEGGFFPSQNQNQNSGRASSVAKSSRGSRPPLAEKEREIEETGSRRSLRPLSQSPSPLHHKPPSPTRGKGKGRMIKTSLETVAEDETPLTPVADPFTPTSELPRSPPTPARKSITPRPPARKSATPPSRKSVSPPSSETKPSSSTSFFPSLPTFAIVRAASRPSAPSGRVGRTINRPHTASARRPMTSTTKTRSLNPRSLNPSSTLLLGLSTTTTNGPTNTSMFPAPKIDLGRTPGGLAFKTTGRAPPGTPAATNTLYGTEVARDTRFADLAYDLDVSGSVSWEDSHPIWAAGIPHNAANP